MATTANWFILTGFIVLVLGFVLRTVVMMRSSDAASPGGRVLYGRALLVHHRQLFPRSSMPLLARSLILSGVLVLLAGIAIEISR
ncbi:MAG: hypothetical protein WCC87_00705 [Candidatus Korobacteraceae bacterium]